VVKLADLYRVMIEAGEDALSHQLDVVDPCREFETVELSKFLKSVILNLKVTSKHQILIVLS